ncbi:Rec8p ASCRUDRAFT_103339 [Ascoidea rubescens DSM 1968]|uniref:Rad21/Rec8-like protein N-terminal domain-containing protein n=1 Tax=Ascoidea rubescens DSM 1968 TaxID=1344418 RepID=A0A1D2VRF5_9ASCO|nr:hypothetical protein ASCRUDRAFT_103339 [Ascoidea rubescens DSM 1968]ODV64196.1 hypothetical protein ASCRUDRAFT_103339 [Ascoidea rubescens DSM 1968]
MPKREIMSVSIPKACSAVTDLNPKIALRLSSNLLYGMTLLYKQKLRYFYNEVSHIRSNLTKSLFGSTSKEQLSKLGKIQLILPDGYLNDHLLRDINNDHNSNDFGAAKHKQLLSYYNNLFLRDDPNFDIDLGLLPVVSSDVFINGGYGIENIDNFPDYANFSDHKLSYSNMVSNSKDKVVSEYELIKLKRKQLINQYDNNINNLNNISVILSPLHNSFVSADNSVFSRNNYNNSTIISFPEMNIDINNEFDDLNNVLPTLNEHPEDLDLDLGNLNDEDLILNFNTQSQERDLNKEEDIDETPSKRNNLPWNNNLDIEFDQNHDFDLNIDFGLNYDDIQMLEQINNDKNDKKDNNDNNNNNNELLNIDFEPPKKKRKVDESLQIKSIQFDESTTLSSSVLKSFRNSYIDDMKILETKRQFSKSKFDKLKIQFQDLVYNQALNAPRFANFSMKLLVGEDIKNVITKDFLPRIKSDQSSINAQKFGDENNANDENSRTKQRSSSIEIGRNIAHIHSRTNSNEALDFDIPKNYDENDQFNLDIGFNFPEFEEQAQQMDFMNAFDLSFPDLDQNQNDNSRKSIASSNFRTPTKKTKNSLSSTDSRGRAKSQRTPYTMKSGSKSRSRSGSRSGSLLTLYEEQFSLTPSAPVLPTQKLAELDAQGKKFLNYVKAKASQLAMHEQSDVAQFGKAKMTFEQLVPSNSHRATPQQQKQEHKLINSKMAALAFSSLLQLASRSIVSIQVQSRPTHRKFQATRPHEISILVDV